jgi:hypothetical protein
MFYHWSKPQGLGFHSGKQMGICHIKVTKIAGTLNGNETQSFYLSSKEANHGLMSIGHPFQLIVK